MKVSYVIRTKNEGEFIEETCRRIRLQHGELEHEIIIVDSGSTDNTLECVKKYADKIIEIKPEDFTWGYALNVGIQQASGSIVCLISGHCFLENEFTIMHAVNFLYGTNYCAIYGKQIGNQYLDKMEMIELAEQYTVSDCISSEQCILPGISNACCLLKKEIWEKYKFDENTQSAEDAIWYKTVVEKGYIVAYNPTFVIIHGHRFSIEYMYRKWYWRIYEFELMRDRRRGKSVYIFLRFILAFILAITKKHIKFRRMARKEGCRISIRASTLYFLIRETAAFHAKIDIYCGKNMNLKYSELKVPKYISDLNVFIKEGDFYDIEY